MKFRRKSVAVDAIQWTGKNGRDLRAFLRGAGFVEDGGEFEVDILGGAVIGSIGDWIIKDVNGEFYPCRPDVFEKTYEKVEE